MTQSAHVSAIVDNTISTYVEIARAVGDCTIEEYPTFVLCTGTFNHPISNFAFFKKVEDRSIKKLHEASAGKSHFNIYRFRSCDRDPEETALSEAGFSAAYALIQMTAKGRGQSGVRQLIEAVQMDDRLDTTSFMSRQFFSLQTPELRRRISDATAHGQALKLFQLTRRRSIAGAVMLHDHGGIRGLFNLCVSANQRGKGIGAEIVEEVLNNTSTDETISLQCDSKLAGWYERLGFQRVGLLQVYGVAQFRHIDIID